jgi:ribonuclease HI
MLGRQRFFRQIQLRKHIIANLPTPRVTVTHVTFSFEFHLFPTHQLGSIHLQPSDPSSSPSQEQPHTPYFPREMAERAINQDRIYNAASDLAASKNTLTLSIHGSCFRNGAPGAKASYGIFISSSSPHNTSGILPSYLSHKSQNAVLYACQRALEIVEDHFLAPSSLYNTTSSENNAIITEVVIKTHSQYLVRCLTEFVTIWERNGYLNAGGKPVVNRGGVEKLESMIRDGEIEKRLSVRFWLVGKKENLEAIPLAESAFDRYVFLLKAAVDILRVYLLPRKMRSFNHPSICEP